MKKPGFTLLEVMLSIAIMTIVAAAIFPTVAWIVTKSRNLAEESQAGYLMQEGMEITYNVFLGNWDADWENYPAGVYHPAQSLVDGKERWILLPDEQNNLETRYNRKIELFKTCRNTVSGELMSFPCGASADEDKNSRLVKTTVWWNKSGKEYKLSANLLLTNFNNEK